MFYQALVEDEDASECGETFGSALHLSPIFSEHDGSRPPNFSDFDLPHFDSVHEHSHHQPHRSSQHVRNC